MKQKKLSQDQQDRLDWDLLQACGQLDPFWVGECLKLGANPNIYASESSSGCIHAGDFPIHACLRALDESGMSLATEARQCIESLAAAGADIDAPSESDSKRCPLALFLLHLSESRVDGAELQNAMGVLSTLLELGAQADNPTGFGEPINMLWNWHQGEFASERAMAALSLIIENGVSKSCLEKCMRELGDQYRQQDQSERVDKGIAKAMIPMVLAGARPQAFGRAACSLMPERHWAAILSANERVELSQIAKQGMSRRKHNL